MNIKEYLKKIIRKIVLSEKATSEDYVQYLRKKGVWIGDRTRIFVPTKTEIDLTRPYLIEIGNDVQITKGVTILTHGFDWAVLKGVYGEVLGSAGKVTIGDNVFIGMNTTILKGTHIGNNVIIGANSLVNKDIPDNCVAAGNPCKVIMSLDEYYKKRKEAQVREAKEIVEMYRSHYGKEPDEKALHEFFWLFTDKDEILLDVWENMMKLVGNYEITKSVFHKNKKTYNDMQDFLKNV